MAEKKLEVYLVRDDGFSACGLGCTHKHYTIGIGRKPENDGRGYVSDGSFCPVRFTKLLPKDCRPRPGGRPIKITMTIERS